VTLMVDTEGVLGEDLPESGALVRGNGKRQGLWFAMIPRPESQVRDNN
jgi:hypothetical protein